LPLSEGRRSSVEERPRINGSFPYSTDPMLNILDTYYLAISNRMKKCWTVVNWRKYCSFTVRNVENKAQALETRAVPGDGVIPRKSLAQQHAVGRTAYSVTVLLRGGEKRLNTKGFFCIVTVTIVAPAKRYPYPREVYWSFKISQRRECASYFIHAHTYKHTFVYSNVKRNAIFCVNVHGTITYPTKHRSVCNLQSTV